MGRIHTLSPALANQIAAGEVVERPASVVKELVENSVDAGATRVRVDIEEGGIRRLRVRDDGHGMDADDLALALARHATSKLREFEDLAAVATLGFRGEALPSIASVARLRVVSRPPDAACAMAVEAHGEAFEGAAVIAEGPSGTTVEVNDLFFNTPARRRFLRTPRTEALHVEEAVRRIALARPTLALSLYRDGKRVLDAPAVDRAGDSRRIAAVCGRDFAERAVAFDEASGELRCTGWVSPLGDERAHADVQHLVVNGRSVRDPLLRHAVRTALEGGQAGGRHPAYVLYLELPNDELDVNVHPTKHEVRFREARTVHDFVTSVVGRAAGAGDQAPLGLDATGAVVGTVDEVGQGHLPGGARDSASPLTSGSTGGAGAHAGQRTGPMGAGRGPRASGRASRPASASAYLDLARRARDDGVADGRGKAVPIRLTPGFGLFEDAHGEWRLVDVSRLAEATVREVLQARLAGQDGPVHALLLPEAARLPSSDLDAAETTLDTLATLGLELRRTAPDEFVLLELPLPLAWLAGPRLMPVLASLLSAGADAAEALAGLCAHGGALAADIRLDEVAAWIERAPEPVGEWSRPVEDSALARAFEACRSDA